MSVNLHAANNFSSADRLFIYTYLLILALLPIHNLHVRYTAVSMIRSLFVLIVVLSASTVKVIAFSTTPAPSIVTSNRITTVSSTQLYTSTSNTSPISIDDEVSRREMIQRTLTASIALPSLSLLLLQPQSAHAAVAGVNKVNAKLATFGLPKISDLPDGFVPILEIYGKGKNRNPLLVTFNHPLNWVVTLPSNNNNGEDGTIQVGDYGKGDTATLFVDDNVSASELSKTMIEEGIRKCISQRGDNMYQNFKLVKVTDGPGPYIDGQSYQIAEFKYQLITGAGFEVDRKGIASVTMSNKKQMEIFWAASIDARYKKTSETLRNIVTSFRCYANGLNFSDEIIA